MTRLPTHPPANPAGEVKLTMCQLAYLRAVAASDEPYTPRHGRTANWALNHGYVDTIVRLSSGHVIAWEALTPDSRSGNIEVFLGQRITARGAHLLTTQEETNDGE